MGNFTANLPHLLMSTIVIAAVSALAGVGVITGSEALPVIGAAAGFSMGGGVALGSASGAAVSTLEASTLNGHAPTVTLGASPPTEPPAPPAGS